jgi:hypothetical protein
MERLEILQAQLDREQEQVRLLEEAAGGGGTGGMTEEQMEAAVGARLKAVEEEHEQEMQQAIERAKVEAQAQAEHEVGDAVTEVLAVKRQLADAEQRNQDIEASMEALKAGAGVEQQEAVRTGVKAIMSEVFIALHETFDEDTSYTGKQVLTTLRKVMKRATEDSLAGSD